MGIEVGIEVEIEIVVQMPTEELRAAAKAARAEEATKPMGHRADVARFEARVESAGRAIPNSSRPRLVANALKAGMGCTVEPHRERRSLHDVVPEPGATRISKPAPGGSDCKSLHASTAASRGVRLCSSRRSATSHRTGSGAQGRKARDSAPASDWLIAKDWAIP